KLEVRERVIAWTAQHGSVAILTDRARHIRVGNDGNPTTSWFSEPDGRTAVRVAREVAPGIVVAQLVTKPESTVVGEPALLVLTTGQDLVRIPTSGYALLCVHVE